jgi:hypothetical protein
MSSDSTGSGMFNSGSRGSTYFGAEPASETASILMGKSKSFFNVLESNFYLDKLTRMWRMYHGCFDTSVGGGHQTSFTGEQEELVSLHVNHFRNLAQHMYVMITSNRPVMEARAINSDYKSMAQTYLANSVLEYYMREKHLEDALKTAVEMAIVLGAGFIKMEWNATAGEVYDVDEHGQEIKEGDLEFTNLSPFDVVFDGSKENTKLDWYMIRGFKNRFDLIAKYPELRDQIMGIPSKSSASIYRMAMLSNDVTDDVPVYEFYHKRTECMPQGRYMLFVAPDAVLLDTPLPYRVMPIFRVSAGEILGTPYGYSPMFDVFPLQECIDALYSTIMTNESAFGVQNVFVPRGSDLTINSIHGSMNIMEGNTPPIPINLTQTPAEIFKFLDMLIQASELISGVNSVARGQPEASLKSGAALALVQSMALQFISGLQQSYVKLIEDAGTALIQILKDYANTPKVIALVGKNNKMLLKEFTGDDLNSINRVMVDVGNPLSRTIAGRVQMAEQMMQMGLIKEPTEYFQVLNTGRLDVMFHGDVSQQLLVSKENEWLSEGKNPPVFPLDIHVFHIEEHRSVLDDPDIRTSPEILKIVMDHIQEHVDKLRTTDPAILQLTGQQPLPPPGPPPGAQPPPGMMPPPGPGGPPMQGPPPQMMHPPGPPMQGPPPHIGPPMPPNAGMPGGGPPGPGPVHGQGTHPGHNSQMNQPPGPHGGHSHHPLHQGPPVKHGPGHRQAAARSDIGAIMGLEPGRTAQLPKVQGNLLPNPNLQEGIVGNVK